MSFTPAPRVSPSMTAPGLQPETFEFGEDASMDA